MPLSFAGVWEGKSLRDKYPSGADPYVMGESANAVFTYGYDSVTQMQETKCSLCRIKAA
jgi:formate dehydrogenase major subunit